MSVVLAHAMHWVSALAYVLPVAVLVLWLVVVQLRERARSS